MVKLIAAMALVVALMFTGSAYAKDKPMAGKITEVKTDTDGKVVTGFTIHTGKKDTGTDVTFTIDSSTTVTLADGTTAKDSAAILAALVTNAHVKVVAGEDKKATAVTIVEHKKKAA